MSILDLIITLFVTADDRMKQNPDPIADHSQQRLTPAELVTIGLLYALKGVSHSQFYRWLCANYAYLFPCLPERTRLFRRLSARQDWTELFLAQIGLLGIADSFGIEFIELIHPIRQNRAKQGSQAKKGLSNHRWIVGVKVGVLVNHLGRVCDWLWDGANVHDSAFRSLLWAHPQTIGYVDSGFHKKRGDPALMRVCLRGQCNFRFLIESVFSLWTRFISLKKITERSQWPIQAHLGLAMAAFNLVQEILGRQDDKGRVSLTMADICL